MNDGGRLGSSRPSLSDRNRSPNPRRYLYPRLATDRSLNSAASINRQASTNNTHAARPVYQMKASIMKTPPLTRPGRPRQHLPEKSAVLGRDGGFSFADLQHPPQSNAPNDDAAGALRRIDIHPAQWVYATAHRPAAVDSTQNPFSSTVKRQWHRWPPTRRDSGFGSRLRNHARGGAQ